MKTNLSNYALMVCLVLPLMLSACGASVPSVPTVISTRAVTNTSEPTVTATQTAIPTITPSPTVTPDIAATQQYEDFFALVQKIHEAGQIPGTDGKYLELDDYRD
ncbi:MAG: hypothetical protein ABIU06_20525, partial [Anaerolineales bacterium]